MKKLLCFMLALTVIGSLFAVNVSAAEVLPMMDFTVTEDEPELEGWKPDVTRNNTVTIGKDPLDPENDVLVFTHDPEQPTGGGAVATKSFSSPASGEVIWMFDIMFNKAEEQVFFEIGLNGIRLSNNFRTEAFGVPNVWYSVIIHVEEGNMLANIYKKIKDSEDPYVSIGRDKAGANHTLIGIKLYTVKGKQSSVGDPDIVYMDNCRVLSGMYMENLKFELNGNEVNTVADINDAGTLNVSYNLMNADLSEESTTLESEYTEMLPAMVIFDKNGKMLDCVSYGDTINLLDNPVELSIETDGFYEKLEGGSVKLYIWDSLMGLQVLMDEVILPAE